MIGSWTQGHDRHTRIDGLPSADTLTIFRASLGYAEQVELIRAVQVVPPGLGSSV